MCGSINNYRQHRAVSCDAASKCSAFEPSILYKILLTTDPPFASLVDAEYPFCHTGIPRLLNFASTISARVVYREQLTVARCLAIMASPEPSERPQTPLFDACIQRSFVGCAAHKHRRTQRNVARLVSGHAGKIVDNCPRCECAM